MKQQRTLVLSSVAILATLFLIFPLAVLLVEVPWRNFVNILGRTESIEALKVSFVSASFSAVIAAVFSIPLAWKLSRTKSPLVRSFRPLILSPIILPPTVAGFALLNIYGRTGLIGELLRDLAGISLPYTSAAVVVAGAFVSMPFVVLVLLAALDQLPEDMEEAASLDGATAWQTFWHIGLPYAANSIAIGVALAWTRALGEFGATLTFAGSLPGVTRTVPMQVYLDLETGPQGAFVLSAITLIIAIALFYLIRIPWRSPNRKAPYPSESPQIP